ncbi:hypothetical protein DMS80_21215 [Klebsiella variicola]|nr:hypothetical protein AN687_29340 [Klebsiella variicola]KPS42412.1 hypothetical protein AN687_01300 [Klebsiella variicola]PXH99684.1 hypothetical protein DMQ94_21740 [Klebsiella variicola]PXK53744.1 hypothetical protein DMS00_19590 [Klebsiella variicola]PXL55749.1 hypothetical protein DMS63_19720 [Klebsiella variicola]
MPGGGFALPGLRSVRPVFNLFTVLAETAGVGGLKIDETFPEGRDKSKVPRSGDFGGQSPLCAPCAMRVITQKKYRERNVL